MQPVTEEELKGLLEEAKKAGKDVSDLESALGAFVRDEIAPKSPTGERIEITTDKGVVVIESTGPAREEDFEDVPPSKKRR